MHSELLEWRSVDKGRTPEMRDIERKTLFREKMYENFENCH